MTISREKTFHKSCPICGGENISDKYLVNSYTVCECKQCSLLFIRDILTDGFLAEVYRKAEALDEEKDIYLDDSNQDFLRYAYRILAEKINALSPGGAKRKLLDVGCSTGTFFEFFPDWDVYGVELSQKHARIAQQKYKNVVLSSMEQADFEPDFFDCITLQDSLDHSNNPLSVVRNAHKFLKQGGIIAIKVHNISCLFAKITGRRFYAIIPPYHLFYFNLQTLNMLLSQCGFEYKTHYYNKQKLKLSTVFLRLSKGNGKSNFARIARSLNNRALGNIPVYKNLHDLITVFAVKK